MIYVRSLWKRFAPGLLLMAGVLGLLIAAAQPAQAQTETVLYSFGSQSGDGLLPQASLIMDKKGNLYGTTVVGGTGNSPACNYPYAGGCGTAFKLVPPGKKRSVWTETVLYSFGSQYENDGVYPVAGLILDAEGNLYGTTSGGAGAYGDGTVFKLTPNGTETVLHAFTGEPDDGSTPMAQLIMDAQGNFYGTTNGGGPCERGTVFELTLSGTETLLYCFGTQSGDGSYPWAGVIMDKKGNLYGTTYAAGADNYGTVFKLTPAGTETVLHSFPSQSGDGSYLKAGLVRDNKGNLYGTTWIGGAYGGGTVFKLSPSKKGAWTETVLYSFCSQLNCTDGNGPYAGLIMDKEGNLYGTTNGGGANPYCGTVFELTSQGVEKVLYSFGAYSGDGCNPDAALLMDKKGNLYGTTEWGGANGYGTVFKIAP